MIQLIMYSLVIIYGDTPFDVIKIDREFLQESGVELAPTPRQQMYIQRLYLYMNLTKPSDRLYLSYARVSSEGKSIRPSCQPGG